MVLYEIMVSESDKDSFIQRPLLEKEKKNENQLRLPAKHFQRTASECMAENLSFGVPWETCNSKLLGLDLITGKGFV